MVFAGTLPMTRVALSGFSPVFITCARALLAALVAGAALLVLRRRPPLADLGTLALIAAMLVFGFPGFIGVAMQTVPASNGGIVLGVLPLFTAAFAVLMAGERPGVAFWFWGLAGAVLVLAFTLRGATIAPGIGHLWLGCAAVCTAIGYVASGKLSRRMPGWEVIGWALVLSSPLTLAGVVLTWQGGVHAPSPASLGALAYLGLGSMFGGFIFWNTGLALGGIARVGQVQLLQTFLTIGISALLLGEVVTPVMLGFAAAVAGVVWLGRKAQVR